MNKLMNNMNILHALSMLLCLVFTTQSIAAEKPAYRAICIPPTAQSLQGIDQQLLKDGLYDVSYSTVDGSRIYFHFDPQAITSYAPSSAMIAGAQNDDAFIMSGYNRQIFITQNQQLYPFISKLFNQKRGIKQGAPLTPAKSKDELQAMGIEFTTLTNMSTLLPDARKALSF